MKIKDIKPGVEVGAEVRVTRTSDDGHVSIWDGVITAVHPDGAGHGFSLRQDSARSSESWFDGAARVRELYGCVQAITPKNSEVAS